MNSAHFKRITLVLFLLVCYVGLCLYLLYFIDKQIRDEVIAEWDDRQVAAISEISASIQGDFKSWGDTLKEYSNRAYVIDLDSTGKEFLRLVYANYSEDISAVLRMNKEGEVLFVVPDDKNPVEESLVFEGGESILTSSKAGVSRVYKTRYNEGAIAYHMPVFKNGQFDGSLSVRLIIDDLFGRYLSSIHQRDVGEIRIIGRDGFILHSTNSSEIGGNILPLFGAEVSNELYTDAGLFKSYKILSSEISNPLNGESDALRYISKTFPVGDVHWSVLFEKSEAEIVKPVKKYQNEWTTVLIALLGGIVFCVLYVFRARITLRETIIQFKADREIRQRDDRFRRVTENNKDWIFCYDLDKDTFDYSSPALTRITGYDSDEIRTLDQYRDKIVHPHSVASFKQEMVRSCNGEDAVQFEYMIETKKGETKWVIQRNAILKNDEGRVTNLDGNLGDITKQKNWANRLLEAKNKAEVANRIKTEFMAMISHELRTPLNPVIGYCDMLLMDCEREEDREGLNIIKDSAQHLHNVINDILDISSIESGKLVLIDEEVYLEEFFYNSLSAFMHSANEKKLDLSIELDDKLPLEVFIDPKRLRQVITNLVGNAIKFTDKGEIKVSCRGNIVEKLPESEYDACVVLEFSVKDTGIGISEADLKNVFEPFTQIDSSPTRKYEGTGLGLAICKKLVEKMNGSISVTSTPGEGSEFIFTVCAGVMNVIKRPSNTPIREKFLAVDNLQTKVLCLEDDQHTQSMMRKLFGKFKITYDIASTVEEALKSVKANDYNILIVDLHLADVDGHAFVKEYKSSITDSATIPYIIVCSADARESMRTKSFEYGADAFLTKPLDLRELAAEIRAGIAKDE